MKSGFTLLELLIALAIFVIIATITTSVMYYAVTTRDRINKHADNLSALHVAITLLQHDLAQIVERPVRSTKEQLLPAFIGLANYIEFTHGGMGNPQSILKRSSLQRIAWSCQNNQLIRRSWPALDTVNHQHYAEQIFLTDLVACNFAYLDYSLQVLPKWRANAIQQKPEPFPKAVRLTISQKLKANMLILLFIIPEALYATET